MDVKILFMNGVLQTYAKIDRLTEGTVALRLEVKKYKSLPTDKEMKHIASIPYSAIMSWTEAE